MTVENTPLTWTFAGFADGSIGVFDERVPVNGGRVHLSKEHDSWIIAGRVICLYVLCINIFIVYMYYSYTYAYFVRCVPNNIYILIHAYYIIIITPIVTILIYLIHTHIYML